MDEGNSATPRAADPLSGPAAMAQTSIGLVFLYELRDDDIFAYAERSTGTALQRVRWLLQRIASKSSGSDAADSPQTLTPAEAQSLTPAEIESLVEIYLGSPKNQWYESKSRDANHTMVRSAGESAIEYLDRLIRRYAAVRHAGAASAAPMLSFDEVETSAPSTSGHGESVSELIARFAATIQASQDSIQGSLRWAAGAFVIALAMLGGGAAWLAYQSHLREGDNDRKTDAWQQQMKIIAENNAAMERGFTELAAENARLKERIQMLESRPARPVPKATVPPPPPPQPRTAPPRTPAKASKPSPIRR